MALPGFHWRRLNVDLPPIRGVILVEATGVGHALGPADDSWLVVVSVVSLGELPPYGSADAAGRARTRAD